MRTSGASFADGTMVAFAIAIGVGVAIILVGGPREFLSIVEHTVRAILTWFIDVLRGLTAGA